MTTEKECLKCGEDFMVWDNKEYCEKCEGENGTED